MGHYEDSNFGCLEGKMIQEVAFNADKSAMKIRAFNYDYYWQAYGDCCSESWFNHLDNADALGHGGIISVEEVSGPDDEPSERQEVDRIYFVKFTTTLGMATLEMRNASNGYYGGGIEKLSADRAEREFGPFIRCTEDF